MEDPRRPPVILIANDQEWSARSLESIFAGEGYSVLRAFTGNQALQRAEASRPDVIILDRQMPDLDGVEVCRRLRADPRFGATTPILITTAGQAGRPQRLEAFGAGAWDFVGQPIDGEIILLKIRTFLQAKQAIDGSRVDGLIDPATGLYTKQGLARRAREIASEARRERQAVSCVVFTPDLPALESALLSVEAFAQEIAGFFRAAGRSSDAVGRLSPLEFGVIAPATTENGVARMVERLENATAAFSDPAFNGEGRISLRVGYCSVADYSDSPLDPVDMIERAGAVIKTPIEARPTT
jgi:PleD family two-component response regulator